MRWMLRSKIHKATVTDADLRYEGSITIDEDLIDAVGLLAGEKVLVASNTSGNRLETYVIAGARGSGAICMNGAAAHLIKKGEEIIVMGFELSDVPDVPIVPKMVLLEPGNKVLRRLEKEFPGKKS
ncbi:MAG: aspartate 1-decarboxylase [Terriglobales bacterium]|jgi:aspartate 1-decarboxylase